MTRLIFSLGFLVGSLLVSAPAIAAQEVVELKGNEAWSGSRHNGARLSYRAIALGKRGTRFVLSLQCRKNWNGSVEALGQVAVVVMKGRKDVTLEKTLHCHKRGGIDGAVKTTTAVVSFNVKGMIPSDIDESVFVVGTLSRESGTAWDVWSKDVENEIKRRGKEIVDKAIDATVKAHTAGR